MAQFSNAQILSTIISRYAQPIVQGFAGSKLASLPFIQAIENKVKSTGWVGANWSLSGELSPIINGLSEKAISPIIMGQLTKVDDALIPMYAHTVIDSALANGKLELFDGNVELEKSDLQELKRLLNLNLPYKKEDEYQIITTLETPTEEEKKEESPAKTEELKDENERTTHRKV